MAISVERATRRQVVYREVNERIAELTAPFLDGGARLFICECSNIECADALEITYAEYEAVRKDAAHFVVAPGHQLDEIERVVSQCSRFAVVEKLGEAGLVAIETAPRVR